MAKTHVATGNAPTTHGNKGANSSHPGSGQGVTGGNQSGNKPPRGEVSKRLADLWTELGPDGSYKDMQELWSARFPRDVVPSQSSISNAKKEAFNLPTNTRGPRGSNNVNVDGYEPTATDLEAANNFANKFGSIDNLINCLQRLRRLQPVVKEEE